MSLPPSSPLLLDTLRTAARRYRLPAMPRAIHAGPATAIALAIEHARQALACGTHPQAALEQAFVNALARLIHEALRPEAGDPAFQAMLLKRRVVHVKEYAALCAKADEDRRTVHAAVNAIAHPAKQQRTEPGPERAALTQLHGLASSASWSALAETARQLRRMGRFSKTTQVERALAQLLDGTALGRLQRLAALDSDPLVRQYQALSEQNGPRSGSATAVARGAAAQLRGAAVEASAQHALEALAGKLNETAEPGAAYRVVTSMRVPSSIPASADRAKSEWDAVLLREAPSQGDTPAWDVCLLVEAKASVDAATMDLPRLLRGLQLLAHAEAGSFYPFKTRQGIVPLRGASLRALPTGESGLANAVLYCCDAPAETTPRLLGAASRMQLLSAESSLEFACNVIDGREPSPRSLEPVWRQLLESPRWAAVLAQYPMLRQVRELMVHTDDFAAAILRPLPRDSAVRDTNPA